MISALPADTEHLTFRRFDTADVEPMHSHQGREDYARYAWRGPRSREVCERIGMRLEATLRESHHQLGQWREELVHAVLADEL